MLLAEVYSGGSSSQTRQGKAEVVEMKAHDKAPGGQGGADGRTALRANENSTKGE